MSEEQEQEQPFEEITTGQEKPAKKGLLEELDELKKEIDGLSASIGKNKNSTNDVNTKAQVNEKEIQLLKLQIQEIQLKAKNPLGG